jgi:hypothetical protein
MVSDVAQIKYNEKVTKKWGKDKYKKKHDLLLSLYNFGYKDYDKNLKAITKNKEDLNLILNNIETYYKK